MKAELSPPWQLTTEHAASSYVHPVLVNGDTGDVYGPRDMVQLYPSHEPTPAKIAVKRLAETLQLTSKEQALVDWFVA